MSDWIQWTGGKCPVPHDAVVEVRDFDGTVSGGFAAGVLDWEGDSSITAYRVRASQQKPALARQEGGLHYKAMLIQPFEYIHANGLGFAEGCVVKYVSRWRAKGGVEDLKKARHFLDLLIEAEGSAK